MRTGLLLWFLLFGSASVYAPILNSDIKEFDFSGKAKPQGIRWSNNLLLKDGLVHSGQSDEIWIESEPFSVARAWRPPASIELHVLLFGSSSGESSLKVYFRYSADKVH